MDRFSFILYYAEGKMDQHLLTNEKQTEKLYPGIYLIVSGKIFYSYI